MLCIGIVFILLMGVFALTEDHDYVGAVALTFFTGFVGLILGCCEYTFLGVTVVWGFIIITKNFEKMS